MADAGVCPNDFVTRGLEIASVASRRIATKSDSMVNQQAVPNEGPATSSEVTSVDLAMPPAPEVFVISPRQYMPPSNGRLFALVRSAVHRRWAGITARDTLSEL